MRLWFIVMALAFLALIPAFIAEAKGRSFHLFWLYGFFLFPFALIDAKLIEPTAEKKAGDKLPDFRFPPPDFRFPPPFRIDPSLYNGKRMIRG